MYYCGINIDRHLHKTAAIDKVRKASPNGLSFIIRKERGEKQLTPIKYLKISKYNPLNTIADTEHSQLSGYRCYSEQNPEVKALIPAQSESLCKLYIRQAKSGNRNSYLCNFSRQSSTQSEL